MTTSTEQAPTWEPRVAEKRKQCFEAIPESWRLDRTILEKLKTPLESNKNNIMELDIPRQCSILSKEEINITEDYDVAALLKALASGKLTSVDVTVAFSKRAAIAQQLINCLTETCFEDAQKRAAQLDEMRAKGQLAGPLHGLPISLKDGFQVAGTQATLGLISYLGHKSESNSPLVDLLLDLGAVVYCKTNIPQTLMTGDSHNHVFGRTLNPWNTSLGAGGSSGGEGALVAMRGSPMGVGTDIAGSIRIPALCCGTYGFRPTAGRVPYGGQNSCSDKNLPTILACAGPLANDLDSLGLFMRAVVGARPHSYDATAMDMDWRELPGSANKSKLRLGVLAEDPAYPIHPPVRKAVADAVQLLQAEGHEIIHLSAQECRTAHAVQVAWGLFGLDTTARSILKAGGEDEIPSRLIIAERLRNVSPEFLSDLKDSEGLKRLSGLNAKRRIIEDEWRKVWNKHGLDAVVGQAAQNTAVEHDEFGMPPYTVILNLLDVSFSSFLSTLSYPLFLSTPVPGSPDQKNDPFMLLTGEPRGQYPACVIPFQRADASSTERDFEVKAGQSAPQYNPDNIDGAPCSIQVFTSTMRDEECLEIAKVVDECLKKGSSK